MRLLLALLILLSPATLRADDLGEVRALLESRRFVEARALLDGRIASRVGEAEYESLLGAALLGLGDLESARARIERSISIGPSCAESHLLLARCAAAESASAGLLKRLGLAGDIKRSLEEAVRLDPALVAARVDLVRFHATAAGIAGGDIEEAYRQAVAIEKLDPAAGAFARGYIAYRQKRYAEASTAFERSIELDSLNRDTRIWAGYLFMETEQYERAFEVLEPLLELDYPPARFELGRTAAYSSTRLDEGEVWLTSYLRDTPMQGWPSHARTWAFLGLIRERDGRPDEARVAWERALRIDPDVEEAREGLKRLPR